MREVGFGVLIAVAVVWRDPRPASWRAKPVPAALLRLPANTAYLTPDADAARFPRDGFVAPFAKAGVALNWYGEFKTTGAVAASASVTLPKGDTLTLRLIGVSTRADGWRSRFLEAHVLGADTAVRVVFGELTVAEAGYARFALTAPGAVQSSAAKIGALELQGTPLEGAHFNLDPRRNAASVHLRYATDSTELITGFYNEVQAVEDPVTTYYMATGFARGYFGMQVNSPTERRIIFSVWDAGDGTNAKDRSTVAAEDFVQLVGKGDGVVAEVFGNEGTGGHSHLVYNWKTGSSQRFFVTAKPEGTHTIYSGYWFHPEQKRWQLIASFRAPKDGKGLRRLYSFSENFGGSTGHLLRRARFGPQWVRMGDGSWRELTQASFSHDATGKENRLDRAMGVEDGRFHLQHGGFVPGFTASGTLFTRPSSGGPPTIVLP